MSRWLLGLLLTVAAAQCVAARDAVTTRDARAVIDSCIRQLDPGLDVGFARIAERCPDLAPALSASPWAPWLPADWHRPGNELTAAGLGELRILLTRQPAHAAVHAPRIAQVAAVLAGLEEHDGARHGWWARFKEWLREVFAPRPGNPGDGWLRHLLGGLTVSRTLLDATVLGALAVVVALAAVIVVNELRVAGVLGRARTRVAGVRRRRGGAPAALTLRELEEASPAEQPRLLLELIVTRLSAQERLPPARALTVHELARAARLADEGDRARLEALAVACERLRFSASEVPPPMLAAALARGRELLGSLALPRAQPHGAL
jgi:hypothetical protein